MKILALILVSICLTGCGKQTKSITLEGKDGVDGKNGHSLVSVYTNATLSECRVGGYRLDIAIDMDDSLSVTEGDKYQSSFVLCNGANGADGLQGSVGAQGPQGVQGLIGPQGLVGADGTVGPQGLQGFIGPVGPVGAQGPQGAQGLQGLQGLVGASGTNATASIAVTSSGCNAITGTVYFSKDDQVYDKIGCDEKNKVATLTGADDTFWVASNKLAVQFTKSSIKIITFN